MSQFVCMSTLIQNSCDATTPPKRLDRHGLEKIYSNKNVRKNNVRKNWIILSLHDFRQNLETPPPRLGKPPPPAQVVS